MVLYQDKIDLAKDVIHGPFDFVTPTTPSTNACTVGAAQWQELMQKTR